MKRDPVVIIVVAMVVTVMLVWDFRWRGGIPATAPPVAASMNGQAAPDFTLETLDGKTVHLSDFQRQGRSAEFLGDLVPALQDRDALVRRAAKAVRTTGIADRGCCHGRCQPQGNRRVRP